MRTLKDARVGDTVTVARLHGEGAVKRRIMDMGITKGVTIFVRKVAPPWAAGYFFLLGGGGGSPPPPVRQPSVGGRALRAPT